MHPRATPGGRPKSTRASRGRGLPGLGVEAAVVGAGRAGRDPGRVREGARRDLDVRARARRRRRRPHREHRDRAEGRAGRRHPRLRRTPDPLGHPRARHGFGHERHGGVGTAPGRRHVLRVQRLHAARGAARRALGLPHRVRVVARLGRRRRGRPDPPADRAAHGDARDPGPVRGPSGGRQRGGGGLALAHRRRRPDGTDPHPPGASRCSRAPRERGARGRRPRRVRARRRARRRPRSRAHRHRFRGPVACVGARDLLAENGFDVRVVSMPSWDRFAIQADEYQDDRASARRAHPRGRSRRQLRLGSLRRRQRVDRPLRRVRAGRPRHGRVRLHCRERGRRALARCSLSIVEIEEPVP